MKNPKRNAGCLSSLLYIFFAILIFSALISFSFYGLVIIVCLIGIIYICKFFLFLLKKIYTYIEQKYKERVMSGKLTLTRKFINILDIDNWNNNEELPFDPQIISDENVPEESLERNHSISSVENTSEEKILTNFTEKDYPIKSSPSESSVYINRNIKSNDNILIDESISFAKEETLHSTPIKKKVKAKKYMNQYDLERFAIECNAYVVREERNHQSEAHDVK